ncbi:MAG: diguanylate cyclase [Gammaproteobacteria bacterium]
MNEQQPPAGHLQRSASGSARLTDDSDEACAPTGPAVRVLLVDDQPAPLEVLEALLTQLGFDAHTALGGAAALRALQEAHFDIMLLDLVMPDIDGHAVLDFCLQHAIATKTIVLSGDDTFDAARHALQCGAFDFVRKPYDPAALLATIGRAVRQAELEHENRRITTRLRDSESLHRFIVNHSPDLVYMLDHEGRFTFLNDRAETMLGYAKDALLGVHWEVLVDHPDREVARHVLNERRTGARASTNVEMRLLPRSAAEPLAARSETSFWVEVTATGVYGEAAPGRRPPFLGSYGTIRDITERKRTEATISFRANHDPLTRLPNRALLRDRLDLAIAQAERNGSRIAVMFLDLDGFKEVNDRHGHATGDRLLQAVAARLRGCLRRGDTLARFGGDEFTLVLPEVEDIEAVRAIADKVLEMLHDPFHIDDLAFHVGTSVGIAVYPHSGRTHDELVRNADAAMYRVKSAGKHGYHFYTEDLDRAHAERGDLDDALRDAVAQGALEVSYQPRVCLHSGTVVALEPCVRWRHPQRGLLDIHRASPGHEDQLLAARIDRFKIARALEDTMQWKSDGARLACLALPLSGALLRDTAALDDCLHLVTRAVIDPLTLVVEIEEHDLARDQELLPPRLRRLRAAGCKLGLSGFATGYAPFALLEHVPLDAVKLAAPMTASIGRDELGTQPARAVLGAATALDLGIVAEGVEHAYQAHFLARHGCQTAQGALFGLPLPRGRVRALLDGQPHPAWSAIHAAGM